MTRDNEYAVGMLIATIENALEALKALLGFEDAGAGGCEHTDREDLGTFGGPVRWRCRQCGYVYEGGTVQDA